MSIEKAKTIKDLSCSGTSAKAGRELCELYRSQWNQKVKISIERANDGVLTLKSGATSVKIERTEKPFEFKLNDQLIDMHKYPTQERLGLALDAAMSRKSASLWPALIDSAYAKDAAAGDDQKAYAAAKAASQSLILKATEWQNCATYQAFIKRCLEDSDKILKYLRKGSYKYMDAKTSEKNVIDPKLDKLTDNLSKTDGQINAWYGRALQCDCADSKNGQVACNEKMGFGEVKDPAHLTEPRQKGMDRCQRLLSDIAQFPAPRDAQLKEEAKKILEELDQNILNIKAEPPINGLSGGSSK